MTNSSGSNDIRGSENKGLPRLFDLPEYLLLETLYCKSLKIGTFMFTATLYNYIMIIWIQIQIVRFNF